MNRIINYKGDWYNVVEHETTWELCRFIRHHKTGQVVKYLSIYLSTAPDYHTVVINAEYEYTFIPE